MEPFVRTIIVVARHHVTVTNVLTQAVLLVVAPLVFVLVLGVLEDLVTVLILAVDSWRASRSSFASIVVAASAICVRQFTICR